MPQVSVSGPFVFLVDINDIVNVVQNSNSRLFVDSTCPFIEIDNQNTVEELVNEELNHIHDLNINWRINFNALKTKNTYSDYST